MVRFLADPNLQSLSCDADTIDLAFTLHPYKVSRLFLPALSVLSLMLGELLHLLLVAYGTILAFVVEARGDEWTVSERFQCRALDP